MPCIQNDAEDAQNVSSDEVSLDDVTDVHTSPNKNALVTSFRENLINFTLKCREKNIIPQTVQQDIFDDVKNLFQDFKEHYDSTISYHLQQNGFTVEDCPELLELLKSADFF